MLPVCRVPARGVQGPEGGRTRQETDGSSRARCDRSPEQVREPVSCELVRTKATGERLSGRSQQEIRGPRSEKTPSAKCGIKRGSEIPRLTSPLPSECEGRHAMLPRQRGLPPQES